MSYSRGILQDLGYPDWVTTGRPSDAFRSDASLVINANIELVDAMVAYLSRIQEAVTRIEGRLKEMEESK